MSHPSPACGGGTAPEPRASGARSREGASPGQRQPPPRGGRRAGWGPRAASLAFEKPISCSKGLPRPPSPATRHASAPPNLLKPSEPVVVGFGWLLEEKLLAALRLGTTPALRGNVATTTGGASALLRIVATPGGARLGDAEARLSGCLPSTSTRFLRVQFSPPPLPEPPYPALG